MLRPCFRASPDRGRTWPSYPSGIAMRSPVATNAAAWKAVVAGGTLAQRGMISFSPWLSDSQIEAVRAYVVTEAERRTAEEK